MNVEGLDFKSIYNYGLGVTSQVSENTYCDLHSFCFGSKNLKFIKHNLLNNSENIFAIKEIFG